MSDTATAVARVFLALLFIIGGFNKLMAIAGTTAYLARLGVPSPQIVAWATGAFELVGGLLILVGFKTRWVALAMCAFTAVTIFLGHKFWAVPADQFNSQLTQALKNLAIMGGFLLLYVNGPGRLSIAGSRR